MTDRPGPIHHPHDFTIPVLFDEVAYRDNGSIAVKVPFLEEGDGFSVVSEYYMLEGTDEAVAARVVALLTSGSQSTRMTLRTSIGASRSWSG